MFFCRNFRFFNDTHLFNLETEHWEEMKFSTIDTPSPRSACHFLPCSKNNSVVVFGGFTKEKLKKEKEKGIIHSDMYILTLEGIHLGNTQLTKLKIALYLTYTKQ